MKDRILLAVNELTKSFGGLLALDGASIGVAKGEVALLIGPNGSGKTTLVNLISGVYRPDAGRISFNDSDITNLAPHLIFRRGLVRTFQIPQPFLKLSVLENVLVARRERVGEGLVSSVMNKSWLKEEEENVESAFKILELIKLDQLWDMESYKLSGGQLKLLEAGRALMSGAQMLIMDEPAAGVNPTLAHEIFTHLIDLNRKAALTFLLIEHRLELALPYVNKVYAMFRGRVIAEGKPDEVVKDPRIAEAYMGT